MITLMDRAGKIHQISEAESALFGHRHEVFTRSDVFDFVHPDDFDDVASLFIRMVTGAVSHLHLRYRALPRRWALGHRRLPGPGRARRRGSLRRCRRRVA